MLKPISIPKPQVQTVVHLQVQAGKTILRSEKILILNGKRAA